MCKADGASVRGKREGRRARQKGTYKGRCSVQSLGLVVCLISGGKICTPNRLVVLVRLCQFGGVIH